MKIFLKMVCATLALLMLTAGFFACAEVKKNDKLIIILDFEKIVSDINPETGLKMSELNELGERSRSSVPILIAEDSPLLNKLIVDSLKAAGYVNLIHTENGQQAYDVIEECLCSLNTNDKALKRLLLILIGSGYDELIENNFSCLDI